MKDRDRKPLYPKTQQPAGQRTAWLCMLGFFMLITLVLTQADHAVADALQDETSPPSTDPVVAEVDFTNIHELNRFASYLDIWDVDHAARSFTALLSADEQFDLLAAGSSLRVLADETALLRRTSRSISQQESGIPGYPCYRTVEETFDDLAALAAANPRLASWIDIGDSWEKTTTGAAAGYDIQTLILSNKDVPGPKPKLAVMSAIHAREYTTAELSTRFAEYLLDGYGLDPDITWLLDYHELHLIPIANPDGRKKAESGLSWRKNTRHHSFCSATTMGVDLNRNSSFKWNGCMGSGCSSSYACQITYRGDAPTSEPETQAIEAYLADIFADQRGPNDTDVAPSDAEGAFISIHSYSELILYPWGWSDTPAPNGLELQTLARKFGYFTGYEVCQLGAPNCLYLVDGATDDWSYGTLGIASYTFELGTAFFEQCSVFESDILQKGIKSLLYASKASRRPYQTPSGPEVMQIRHTVMPISAGETVTVTAVADDTRFESNGHGDEPVQTITAARYSIDTPTWITGTVAVSMTVIDSDEIIRSVDPQMASPQLDGTATVAAEIDTSGWAGGRHTILLEAQDSDGNWGVPSAFFIDIIKTKNFLPVMGKEPE